MLDQGLPWPASRAPARALAPPAEIFPDYPTSWYLLCRSSDVRHRPLSRSMLGRRLVAFRAASDRVCVMDARCSHLGADLGNGEVVGDRIRCPFHHWEYGPDGRCLRLPGGGPVPRAAQQASYPVTERHGLVFVFNGPAPLFPLPFFPGSRPEDLVSARPFYFHLDCPWYLIGGNSVDVQHFRSSHDRELLVPLAVSRPAPFSCRVVGRFRIAGNSLRDRLLRAIAGDEVTMDTSDWCGNLIFTTARIGRVQSQGMVALEPMPPQGVRITVVVYVPKGAGILGWMTGLFGGWVRRRFIKSFLGDDAVCFDGARYNPLGLIDEDRLLAEYFCWLAAVSRGRPARDPAALGEPYSHEEPIP